MMTITYVLVHFSINMEGHKLSIPGQTLKRYEIITGVRLRFSSG